jgi:hypothetical protein
MRAFGAPRCALLLLSAAALQGLALVHLGGPQPRRGSVACSAGKAASMAEFTTSELKRLLGDRGVDFRDCLDKADLVARCGPDDSPAPRRRPALRRLARV